MFKVYYHTEYGILYVHIDLKLNQAVKVAALVNTGPPKVFIIKECHCNLLICYQVEINLITISHLNQLI